MRRAARESVTLVLVTATQRGQGTVRSPAGVIGRSATIEHATAIREQKCRPRHPGLATGHSA